MIDATDRDQLVRLAGEQALLKRANKVLQAAQQRDLQALAQMTGTR